LDLDSIGEVSLLLMIPSCGALSTGSVFTFTCEL
jgi:hypothetical protein